MDKYGFILFLKSLALESCIKEKMLLQSGIYDNLEDIITCTLTASCHIWQLGLIGTPEHEAL